MMRAAIFWCLLSLHTFFTLAQAGGDIKLERLTTDDGLTNEQIKFIFQDQDDFIWIGTLSGLNRYDGYEIKTFYNDINDSTSLRNNTTLWMSYGPDDHLWIMGGSGLSVYDPISESFSVPQAYLDKLRTQPAFITKMLKDSRGGTWFAISNRGLVLIADNKEIIEFNAEAADELKLSSNNVTDIVLDNSGQLWVSYATGFVEVIDVETSRVTQKYGLPDDIRSNNLDWKLAVDNDQDLWVYSSVDPFGVYYLNTTTGSSRIYKTPQISSNMVTSVVQTEDGRVWIGADHGGVSILNKQSGAIQFVENDADYPKSLVNNNVNTLFKDRNGGIWIGTTKSGVSYYHPQVSSFLHFKYRKKETAYNDMSSFVEDADGNLWIGTNGKGLLKFDLKQEKFKPVEPEIVRNQPNVVVSLLIDSKGKLWIGSYLEGLFTYADGVFKPFRLANESAGASVWELFEDSKRNIWIGTLNRGVFKYDPMDGSIEQFNMDNGLQANYVTCIEEDDRGNIWLGTGNGLSMYDAATGAIKTLSSEDGDHSLSNNSIISIRPDGDLLWVGTLDGLNRFDLNTEQFDVIRKRQGLASNIVMAIEEDADKNLWISTDRGISKFNKKGNEYDFHSYDISDGLQAENFTEDASYHTRDGRLIFAGQNGFNIFNPLEIEISRTPPKVLLTGLSINNNLMMKSGKSFNGRVLLNKALMSEEPIELKYDQNTVSIEYLAMSYFQSGKLRYQYMLEGYDKDWINASGESRQANYINLGYGSYTFKVRASKGTNSWTEPVSVRIRVTPPFWETPWAFLFYFILIVLILYLTRTYIVHRERLKASIENERKEVEHQHQLDMMKIKFFTNISHEFRTPLSLIITPIERMIKNPEDIKKGELAIVQRNAKRLMTLVNQLLDFRKMEANQHTLSQSSGDIIMFLQDVIDSFSDWSKEKDIPVVFASETKSFYTFFDKDKMEKIMFNLLSNAFKFTMPGGKINVDFELLKSSEGNRAQIMVSDTGIGIPLEKQDLIFNRFFQNELSGDIINNGTGIGLSITKEFVELHKGTISVDSKPNMGTTFTIDIPLKEINSDEDLADELVKELAESFSKPDVEVVANREELPTVLLVEDNFDFRFYLKDNLKQYFNIQVSSNGKEAWKSILNVAPDIVISDVMMPVMDGLELCEKIKSDPRTLQIPVIMLTAQSSDRHRIKGLEAGAIEYISKPFNFEILISSINSALKFQKRVKESGKKIEVTPSEVEIVSVDEQLIAKAVLLVEENMSNSEFSVEDLSHELGYSRGHFYQKILRLTGQTPIDFIRNIRMKRAANLLQKSQLNVSEVAYKVGYNNPKLFSRYFKSVYNMYPSEFRNMAEDTK